MEPEDSEVVAFVAAGEPGWERLRQEVILLGRLAEAGVPVPGVVFEDGGLRLQVRERVPGVVGHDVERLCFGTARLPDAAARYRPGCPPTDRGRRLAAELGAAVAVFQGAVPVARARGIGFVDREPEDWERVSAVLRAHAPDPALISAVAHLRRWEEDPPRRTVLAHGDVHLYNVAVEPRTGGLAGLLDFDAVCLAHPYEDLKFAPSTGYPFAAEMLRAYAEVSNREASLPLLNRFHLRAALAHLEHLSPASDRFPDILAWSRAALGTLVPEWESCPRDS